METVSALLFFCEGNPPVMGGFSSQMDSYVGFDDFFDISLNKRLNNESPVIWDARMLIVMSR